MKQKLASDMCRCLSTFCQQREECLRHTDVQEGERYPFSNFHDAKDNDNCAFVITLEMWEKS